MKKVLLACVVLMICSCGRKNTAERVQTLENVQGEWTEAQSEEAIDIYIDGLKRQEALMEENMEILRQTDFFRASKCYRPTLEKRQVEIQEAEKRLDEKRARLLEEK